MRRLNGVNAADPRLPAIQQASPHEIRNYSIQRLIQSLMRDPMRKEPCLECDLGHAIAQDLKRAPGLDGVHVPLQLSPRMSGLDTKSGSAGGYTIANGIEDMVTILRAKSVVPKMGGTLLSGLSSGVGIPLQTTGSTAVWSLENPGSDIDATDSVFGNIQLQPRTLTCTTSYSRGLLQQSSADKETAASPSDC